MPRRRNYSQTSLFAGETMSLEEFKASVTKKKKRTQWERKLMADVQLAASSFGLMALHVEYYCGNTFYAKCPGCGAHVKVHCNKKINRGLASQPDLLLIAGGIELKHKVNKGKQVARGSAGQELMADVYRLNGIPYLIANESDAPEIIRFLESVAKGKKGS